MRDINNGEGYACGGPASIRVISVHSPQFCCELKIILKKKKLKQSQQNEKINDRHWTPKLTFYKYETFCMILDTLKNKQTVLKDLELEGFISYTNESWGPASKGE